MLSASTRSALQKESQWSDRESSYVRADSPQKLVPKERSNDRRETSCDKEINHDDQ